MIKINEIRNIQEFEKVINNLQNYYSCHPKKVVYSKTYKFEIYEALKMLLEKVVLDKESYEYIANTLPFSVEKSQKDIILYRIKEYQNSPLNEKITYSEIDRIMRCVCMCIKKSGTDLSFMCLLSFIEKIDVLIEHYNINILLSKYSLGIN